MMPKGSRERTVEEHSKPGCSEQVPPASCSAGPANLPACSFTKYGRFLPHIQSCGPQPSDSTLQMIRSQAAHTLPPLPPHTRPSVSGSYRRPSSYGLPAAGAERPYPRTQNRNKGKRGGGGEKGDDYIRLCSQTPNLSRGGKKNKENL